MEILLGQIRSEKRITLKKLAKATGISKSTLQRIEVGDTSPTLDKLNKIAKALDVKISNLYVE